MALLPLVGRAVFGGDGGSRFLAAMRVQRIVFQACHFTGITHINSNISCYVRTTHHWLSHGGRETFVRNRSGLQPIGQPENMVLLVYGEIDKDKASRVAL